VIETAVIKDLGGPDLTSRTFEMGKTSCLNWTSPAMAEQVVQSMLTKAKSQHNGQAPVTVPAPTRGLSVSPSTGFSVSPETWRRPCAEDFNDPYGEYRVRKPKLTPADVAPDARA
jgi:hypothetical protein